MCKTDTYGGARYRRKPLNPKILIGCLGIGLMSVNGLSFADVLSDITNYRKYDANFSSSGQPSAEQLKMVSENGYERVIYIAFNDNKSAINNEDRLVKSLGMDYVHIPVDFDQPTLEDFADFAALMNRKPQTPTLLHCQVNFRASAFSFLYRVIYLNVPIDQAKLDLDTVWQPNEVWYRFIANVLADHALSPQCGTCDWGVNEFQQ